MKHMVHIIMTVFSIGLSTMEHHAQIVSSVLRSCGFAQVYINWPILDFMSIARKKKRSSRKPAMQLRSTVTARVLKKNRQSVEFILVAEVVFSTVPVCLFACLFVFL